MNAMSMSLIERESECTWVVSHCLSNNVCQRVCDDRETKRERERERERERGE